LARYKTSPMLCFCGFVPIIVLSLLNDKIDTVSCLAFAFNFSSLLLILYYFADDENQSSHLKIEG
jgi:hypothetical protein